MSREQGSIGRSLGVQEFECVLRHPDGSVDIAAYAKLAHRERATAMAASAGKAILIVRAMVSAIGTRLAPIVGSTSASGKHHARMG